VLPPISTLRRLPALIVVTLLLGLVRAGGTAVQTRTSFALQIDALSEPGGYFDTDNLISNERSYLQVVPELERADLKGGAYVGVGPDQNFSYIASLRPPVAFIVDIRRDNLLLHLLFKALFAQAGTRIEYLALLFGRAVPRDLNRWRTEPIDRLAAYIETSARDPEAIAAIRRRTDAVIGAFGVPLDADDLATIDRFHRTFINAGLGLRFESIGRPPQTYYPTYRELLLAVDSVGRQGNFLAAEDGFQFVRSLQARNLIVPVVGNLAGPRTIAAIGDVLKQRGEPLSAFYTSNVEFYLARAGTLDRFLENLARMPRRRNAVVIRSVFGRSIGGSTSATQPVAEMLEPPSR
jgi:hypothetical protein